MKTIMVMYMGNEPQTGEANKPFCVGPVEIVQSPIKSAKQAIELSRTPILNDAIIQTSGGFFVTPQFAVGIMPGTSFVIVALPNYLGDSILSGIDGYIAKEINYDTYRRVLAQASHEADVKACQYGDAIEHAYVRYYGIDITKLKVDDQIQIVARADRVYIAVSPDGYSGSFKLDWIVPALSLERVLAAAALIQDLTRELKITVYEISIFLHRTDENTVMIYNHEEKQNSNPTTDQ